MLSTRTLTPGDRNKAAQIMRQRNVSDSGAQLDAPKLCGVADMTASCAETHCVSRHVVA
jgi:hypothetical protein